MMRLIKIKALSLGLILLCFFPAISLAKEQTNAISDRERLIRLETKLEEGLRAIHHRIDALEKRIDALDKRIDALDKRIDGVDKRIDGLQDLIYVLLSAIFAQTVGIVGFVLWDRRSTLSPVVHKQKELEEQADRIEKALKEMAKADENLAKALKTAGLL